MNGVTTYLIHGWYKHYSAWIIKGMAIMYSILFLQRLKNVGPPLLLMGVPNLFNIIPNIFKIIGTWGHQILGSPKYYDITGSNFSFLNRDLSNKTFAFMHHHLPVTHGSTLKTLYLSFCLVCSL